MKARRVAILTALVAVLVSACSPDVQKEKTPVVNDENCRPEIIAKIKDKGAREEFASMCLRRDNFNPSPKKEW
jgi:entry exclusion lipoprotein TrbK